MKKVKLIAAMVLATVICTSSTVVFAEGNTFDIDTAINNAIQNSYNIKIQNNLLEGAKNQFKDAEQNLINLDSQSANTVANAQNQRLEAKLAVDQYTRSLDVVKNDIKQQIYTAYQALMNAKDSLDIEQKKLDNAQANYKKAQIQYDLGMTSKADKTTKYAAYLSEQASFNKIKRQFDLQGMNLNKIIGEPISKTYSSFNGDILASSIDNKTYEDYVADALKNRVEIINAQGNLDLEKYENDVTETYYADTDDESKDSKYYVRDAQNNLDTEKIDIKLEINTLYNDLQIKYKRLEPAKKKYDQEKHDYDVASLKYNLGQISKLDLSTSELSFKQAEASLKSAERDIWMAKSKIDLASGLGTNTTGSIAGGN